MTSHRFGEILTPYPFCHAKMGIVLTTSHNVSQMWQPTSLYLSEIINECPLIHTKGYILWEGGDGGGRGEELDVSNTPFWGLGLYVNPIFRVVGE